jgi:hypothetical protein
LLVPDDPFEREGRWIGWYKANERFHRKIADNLGLISPQLAEPLKQAAEHHSKWRTSIAARLPHGKVTEKPSMPNILKELDFLHLYLCYRGLSQVVHAEPDATRLVHKVEHVPEDQSKNEAIFESIGQTQFWGCFIDESDWEIPIRMAAWGLMVSVPRLLVRIGASDPDVGPLFEKQLVLHAALERMTKSTRSAPS